MGQVSMMNEEQVQEVLTSTLVVNWVTTARQLDDRGLGLAVHIWLPLLPVEYTFYFGEADTDRVEIEDKWENIRKLAEEKCHMAGEARCDTLQLLREGKLKTGELQRGGGVYYRNGDFVVAIGVSGLNHGRDNTAGHLLAGVLMEWILNRDEGGLSPEKKRFRVPSAEKLNLS